MRIQQVIVTGKEQVSLENLDLHVKDLEARELVIETELSFISAGTELANYTAATKDVYTPGSWCAYPWKSGYANIGTVLEAGEKYRDLVGKRVYTNGPHASAHRYKTDPAWALIAPVPEHLSSEDAVAARMAMVAIAGLDASKPQYIRTVVVFGLGMVGNLAAQLFRLTGAVVIGVDPSATRRRTAKECGIPHTIAGTEAEVAEQVRQITNGKMANVAVDAVGHSGISLQAVRVTATGGEVVVLGSPRCEVQGNLTEIFGAAHYRWVTVTGALEWYYPAESLMEHGYSQARKIAAIFQWISDGRLKVQPMITHVLPPTEIKKAYEGLLNQKEDYVGVILRWK
jgi:2-desacetyl-2-hydroxyethyl bacteriochlorophyllide A dehydrogenase